MGIAKEYRCLAHGAFTSDAGAVCPAGCTMAIEREFRTAPALRSTRTKSIDRTLGALAQQYGYTDLSTKNGSIAQGKGNPLRQQPDYRPVWGTVPKGDVLEVGKGVVPVEGGKGGAVAAAAASRVAENRGEASFTEIAKKLPQPRAQVDKKLIYGTQADVMAAAKSAA